MDVKWLLSEGTINKIENKDINLYRYKAFQEIFGSDNIGFLTIGDLDNEIDNQNHSKVYKLDENIKPKLTDKQGVDCNLFLASGFDFGDGSMTSRQDLEKIMGYLDEKKNKGKINNLVNSKYSTLFEDKISFVDLYENNFPVPKTKNFNSLENFVKYLDTEGPQIVKHRFGYDGIESFFVDKNNYDVMKNRDMSKYIVQEPLDIESEIRVILFKDEVLGGRIIEDRTAPWHTKGTKKHKTSRYYPNEQEKDMSRKMFNYADATLGSIDIINLKQGGQKILEFNGVATGLGYPGSIYDLNHTVAKKLKREYLEK